MAGGSWLTIPSLSMVAATITPQNFLMLTYALPKHPSHLGLLPFPQDSLTAHTFSSLVPIFPAPPLVNVPL